MEEPQWEAVSGDISWRQKREAVVWNFYQARERPASYFRADPLARPKHSPAGPSSSFTSAIVPVRKITAPVFPQGAAPGKVNTDSLKTQTSPEPQKKISQGDAGFEK